jgi:hypothetical protein
MGRRQEIPDSELGGWLEREIAGCRFEDARHGKRFRTLLEQLTERIGGSIPFACQDWASTKAAYGFLANERVSDDKILAGHFACTRERSEAAAGGPMLVLHDTTEFIYCREENKAIGMVSKQQTQYGSRPRYHTMRGVLMHSRLVVTQDGLPLGPAAIKFWTRDKFHGANALKRRINPTRVPIEQKEGYRWLENLKQSTALLAAPERIVHIRDRESDIYELFCIAHDAGTHLLLRTCVDRLAGEGDHRLVPDVMPEGKTGRLRINSIAEDPKLLDRADLRASVRGRPTPTRSATCRFLTPQDLGSRLLKMKRLRTLNLKTFLD